MWGYVVYDGHNIVQNTMLVHIDREVHVMFISRPLLTSLAVHFACRGVSAHALRHYPDSG